MLRYHHFGLSSSSIILCVAYYKKDLLSDNNEHVRLTQCFRLSAQGACGPPGTQAKRFVPVPQKGTR